MEDRAKVLREALRNDQVQLRGHIDEAVRSSVEETLNALLLREDPHRRLNARELKLEWA